MKYFVKQCKFTNIYIFGVCVRIIVMETGALVRAGEGLSCPKSLFVQYICIVFVYHIRVSYLCNIFVNILKRKVFRVSPKLLKSSFAQKVGDKNY